MSTSETTMRPFIRTAFLALLLICSIRAAGAATEIIISHDAPGRVRLAAQEVRRYVYLRTGQLLTIRQADAAAGARGGGAIVIATARDTSLIRAAASMPEPLPGPGPQCYRLLSLPSRAGTTLLICGGDEDGALYGAYRFAEHLGVRFYPDGDVIPDGRVPLTLSGYDESGTPRFSMRGIQPFHDFPEGPDWWNLDEYKAVLAQLAKMRMNFIGFHTYPEFAPGSTVKAEPMVWIGTRDQIAEGGGQPRSTHGNAAGAGRGDVTAAYPVLHSHTLDSTWGYGPKRTSDFSFGAAQLFDTDDFGADYIRGRSPWPHTPEENIDIFNRFGALLDNAFSFARRLGIKTCIGTEIPVTIPRALRSHLASQGKDPRDPAVIREVYEGIFSRIAQRHPLDYYWFWTPEGWTWEAVKDSDVERTKNELLIALEAAKAVKSPFTLATCGWVLGPPRDRTEFDAVLPTEIPFSCISRTVGFAPVEPGFAKLSGRPKWQISWMEDDPALTLPQLWAGRTRRDAYDALRYGCTGFMGIHWRTRVLSPNFGALAREGWTDSSAGRSTQRGLSGTTQIPDSMRHLPVRDFYLDWATAQFGASIAAEAAEIFSSIDGGKRDWHANLYRSANWSGPGPGMVVPNRMPWEELSKEYAFVDRFAALAPRVKGAASRERFQYWLNMLQYARAMGRTGCLLGHLDAVMEQVRKESDLQIRQRLVRMVALPVKEEAELSWGDMATDLLATVSTTGELGTVANLEMRSLTYHALFSKHDSLLSAVMNGTLPASRFWKEYRGEDRLIVPARRSVLEKGEPLALKAIVLTTKDVADAKVHWRRLGARSFTAVPLAHVARGVYQAEIPAERIAGGDLEYYVEMTLRGPAADRRTGRPSHLTTVRHPAGDTMQTVVVY